MKGTIKGWKDRVNSSGQHYLQVFIQLSDLTNTQTYLVHTHRNYQHWKPFLIKGTELVGLRLLDSGKVDADSEISKPPSPQLELFPS